MFDLDAYFSAQRQRIDRALESILETPGPTDRILEAMNYSLMANGKRLRPILCLAAAETAGGDAENALPAACALEMVHTYSLIHDDLPAMDNDVLRRGKPTCHMAFDEATAILAGDALLTLAFQTLASIEPSGTDQAAKRLRVIQLISHATGYCGLIQGQMMDIASEGIQLSLADLQSMHRLKTGALIEASLCSGAVVSGLNANRIKMLKNYAQNIGLAFQVTDDILNVEGDPEMMGKAVGTDKLRSKSTYPSLLGLRESKKFAKDLVKNALQALESFDNRAEPLRSIANYIIARKK
jgi:geranylgeranyl diphosphate synthase, type II